MTDCPNAEMRDRLPDLLHERLDRGARALVEAHVAECADCDAELALLREAYVSLTSGGRTVDAILITRAVLARTRQSVPAARQQNRWIDWRIAASVALLVIGGGSVVAVRSMHRVASSSLAAPRSTLGAPGAGASTTVAVQPRPRAASAPTPRAELSAAAGVGDLSDGDLRALLQDLKGIDAVPLTEPEPVAVPVALPGSGDLE